ncbi:MAG: hypothetical protein DRO88_10735 [Promethearchaeia archaeon]|nr:MAG: hypothetical protein DRO88_10735 [Candidatus Lokiarchaeia archaeon]
MTDKNIPENKIDSDYFYCGRCNKQLRYSDDSKFCVNCGVPFVFDVHGKILVDDNNHAYIKPDFENSPYDSTNPSTSPNSINPSTMFIPVPQDMYYGQPKWKKRRTWNLLAGIFLPLITYISIIIVSVIVLIPFLLIYGFDFFLTQSSWFEFFISAFSVFFFLVPLFWIQRYYPGKLTIKQRMIELGLDFKKYSRKELFREILLGIFLGFFGVIVVLGLQCFAGILVKFFFGIDMDVLSSSDDFSQFSALVPENLWQLLLFVATMVFFVGMPEEVMFRGFVQRSFETKMKKPSALILTAVYFAIYHIYIYILNPPLFIYLSIAYLGLSIYLGLIRNWRGDIIASSIMHMVYNSTQMIVIYLILVNI